MLHKISRITFYICCLVLFSTSIVWANDDEKEVVVLGIGVNEEAAKQQAYRNAIQSVIGSLVVSETIVANENLVQDKILSHSDGYVVKATQVGATRTLDGGLMEVTMRITVKSQQLKQKLEAENISIKAIDGQSLFAQKVTKDEAKEDAATIISDKLKDLPASVLVATADINGSTQKSSGNMVRLHVPIEVTVDKKAYATFYKDFTATLDKLGFKSKPYTWKGSMITPQRELLEFKYNRLLRDKNNKILLGVSDAIFRESQSSRWKLYSIPIEIFQTFITNATRAFQLKVELLDKDNAVVVEKISSYIEPVEDEVWQVKGNSNRSGWSLRHNSSILTIAANSATVGRFVTIVPEVIYSGYYTRKNIQIPIASNIVTINMPFDLSENELKSIQSIKCTVSNIPIPKN